MIDVNFQPDIAEIAVTVESGYVSKKDIGWFAAPEIFLQNSFIYHLKYDHKTIYLSSCELIDCL